MEIRTVESGRVIILELHGRLDTTNYSEFEKKLLETIRENETILIDCESLEYISSSGLRALLIGMKNAASGGKKLFLCSLQPNILEIFRISAFINLFKIFKTKEEALGNLS